MEPNEIVKEKGSQEILCSKQLRAIFKNKKTSILFGEPQLSMFWTAGDICLGIKARMDPLTCILHHLSKHNLIIDDGM